MYEEEEEWPKWTAQRGTALTLDGAPLVEVFKKIQTQLEILRNRPIFDPKKIVFPTQPPPRPTVAAPAPAMAPIATPVAVQTSMKIPSGPTTVGPPGISQEIFEERMAELERRLFEVENKEIVIPDPVDISPLNDRIEELSRHVDSSTAELHGAIQELRDRCDAQESENYSKFEKLELAIQQLQARQESDLMATNKKMSDFMTSIDAKLDSQMHAITDALSQTQKFLGQFHRLETTLSTTVEELEKLEHVVAEFVDHKSVSEQRIVSLEFKGGKVGETIENIKSTVKNIQEESVKVTAAIDQIRVAKVNREELKTKADLSVAEHKANQSEIERLDDLNRELNRRITMQQKETSDAILRAQKESEKKIDTLTQWCFKQLGALSSTGDHRGDTGTDIGRIRCLVCDQVVKQATEQDVVFGGPGMTHSIKTRKGSPPRGRDKDTRGRSPPPVTNQRPMSAGGDNSHGGKYRPATAPPTEAKSKLAKLTAEGHHEEKEKATGASSSGAELPIIANPTKIVLLERNPSGSSGINVATNNPAGALIMTDDALDSPPKPSQPISAPRVVATKQPTIVTSLSNPALYDNVDPREFVTDYVPKKDLAVTGADNVLYFRELEGKFAGTGGRRGTEMIGGNKDKHSRPGSAPMKRVHSTSKLQSLGRPSNLPSNSNPLLPTS